jgi:hypothetical protein
MKPRQAWKVLSLMVVLVVVVAAAALASAGYDPLAIGAGALVVLLIYPYVLYKRYHVEVVPERDIARLEDTDDLRLLCKIYGLPHDGGRMALRSRLLKFITENSGNAFTWVAPRAVIGFGSAFTLPSVDEREAASGHPEGDAISLSKDKQLGSTPCPICEAPVPAGTNICAICGADQGFYSSVMETRIGKLLVSQREAALRRKPRYSVPRSGGDR